MLNVYKLLLPCFVLAEIKVAYSLGENGTVAKLVTMITENIEASLNYVFPKDNLDLLEVSSEEIQDYGTYDFIVVGSGAAGAVIANRLSEVSKWKVLLLEAGGDDTDFTKILRLQSYTQRSDMNWGYNTTTQTNGCLGMKDQISTLPHGKVIGGSTTINGAVHIRGHEEDFDRWVNIYGNDGWSYDEVLPYFIKSENATFESRDKDDHGTGGYLTTSIPVDTPGLSEALTTAFEEYDYDYVDHNGPHNNGVSKVQVTLKGNERVSTATAFLKPFIDRENLKISLNSFVTRVLINEDTKAYGVEFVKNETKFIATAKREVILSGGAYNSPQILMLSGIGPSDHLREFQIPVIKDLPVGKYLQDHITYIGLVLKTNKVLYNYTFEESVERYIDHLRPFASSSEIVAFTNFDQAEYSRPVIEFLFSAPGVNTGGMQDIFGFTDEYSAAYTSNAISDVMVYVINLQPSSRGSVTLKSSSPKDKPLIDPNFLANINDVETIYKGIQELLKIGESQAFRDFGAEIIVPDSPNCDDEKLSYSWWICSIRHWTIPAYHPTSSNSMGINESTSVVNPRLCVHGIGKLRVADESIIPEALSAHNMATVIMVGEKAADIIKEDHGILIDAEIK